MASGELPDDPISPTEATAYQFHAIYLANIAAGFSEAQSMYLLGCAMTGNPGIAPGAITEPDDGD